MCLNRVERYSDFLCGLPTRNPTGVRNLATEPLTTADRLRIVHTYVTATPGDGGLGVAPGSSAWDRVESVMALHDHKFNEQWIHSWTRRQLGFLKFDQIREQVRARHRPSCASCVLTSCSSVKLWRCTSTSCRSTRNTSCLSPVLASCPTSLLPHILRATPPSFFSGRSSSSNGGEYVNGSYPCTGEPRARSVWRSVGHNTSLSRGGARTSELSQVCQ